MVATKTDWDEVEIPIGEVSFHPHSFADDAGRLFRWNGRFWRGINPSRASFFDGLFRGRVIQELVEAGLLIESNPTNFVLAGYPRVVSHRSVSFISYPNEWCADMLKDAARTILSLAIELTRRGLTLRDAHPWNVLFDWTRPVFVDLTSIAPSNGERSWSAYDEFCRFSYYPLILMSRGHERIARSLIGEYEGVLRSEMLALLKGSFPSWFVLSRLLKRVTRPVFAGIRNDSRGAVLGFLEQAKRSLEMIKTPAYAKQHRRRSVETLSAYSESEYTSFCLTLRKLLTTLQPGSVLDLSRGFTWTTTLPATMGFKTVSIDPDVARISAIYALARNKNLPILPLVVDFIKPTPSVGYSNHYSIGATERLKCDLVLALGLVDKVSGENHLSFDLIAEGLASFASRWLVVEKPTSGIATAAKDRYHDSGRSEAFVSALLRRFRKVEVVLSLPTTELLLCEK